jgi:hypothetical protein
VRLRLEAPRPVAKGGKTAASLLLMLWCAPGFASSGHDALYEEVASGHICLDAPVQKLSIVVVDHGDASAVPSGDAMLNATDDLNVRTPSVFVAPRVETILREIFDESIPADQEASDATASSPPNAATLEELTAPGLREQSRHLEDIDKSVIRDADGDSTRANTSVPGFSEDDLARYRRQMFRTDI